MKPKGLRISDRDGRIVDTFTLDETIASPRFSVQDLVLHLPDGRAALVLTVLDGGRRYRCQYVDVFRRGGQTRVVIAIPGERFEVGDAELQPLPEAVGEVERPPRPRTTAVRIEGTPRHALDLVGERPGPVLPPPCRGATTTAPRSEAPPALSSRPAPALIGYEGDDDP